MTTKPMPTNIPRRQLGRQLREIRQGAGLSIEHLARLLGRGATTVQRLETGTANSIRVSDLEGICELCNAEDKLAGLVRLSQEAGKPDQGWWHQYEEFLADNFASYLSLEANATRLTQYQPSLCPGLLQTPSYIRALSRLSDMPPEEIDDAVAIRTRRQRLVTRSRSPLPLDVVVEEAVLRRVVGGLSVMAEQARHMADMSENVELRVIPIGAPYPYGGHIGSFVILELVNEPSVVYLEQLNTNIYYDHVRTVHGYRQAHQALKRVALSPGDSKLLLRRIAREFMQ
ncbi:helix-turn-helix domain-containing protein [Nocardia cyriacigeorgica]|uniref:Helix-turn-helix domain-containing protein n=1 Tax=Nocardia cyriacigeorgica TaxID=135487 RepID=A0A6P1D5Q1_9NOCA|nr:helix-turn-helix transcriptional regulator [Nocardia cyriacigeorgica]NEW45767.1 helix-turn-helix domain-containing protein [Nocardia cyriacigeorgica]NEW51973.1 helix-turn-helix domain-containing protein [Nocardia cyriacigeorgica]